MYSRLHLVPVNTCTILIEKTVTVIQHGTFFFLTALNVKELKTRGHPSLIKQLLASYKDHSLFCMIPPGIKLHIRAYEDFRITDTPVKRCLIKHEERAEIRKRALTALKNRRQRILLQEYSPYPTQ